MLMGSLHQVRPSSCSSLLDSLELTPHPRARAQYRLIIARAETGDWSGWRDDGKGKSKEGESKSLQLSLPGHFVRPSLVLGGQSASAAASIPCGSEAVVVHANLCIGCSADASHPSQLAGLLAGQTVCFVACPTEHLKARLQMQTTGPKLYTGPIDCARQVVAAKGWLGLYHGFTGTLLFRSWMGVMCVLLLLSLSLSS